MSNFISRILIESLAIKNPCLNENFQIPFPNNRHSVVRYHIGVVFINWTDIFQN